MEITADYQAYIASVYPNTRWRFEPLSGGLVNTTMRATRTDGEAPFTSLILKHARPYIQVAGPEFEFSTKRQEVEAMILEMFDERGRLHDLKARANHAWRTPRCIRHDSGTEASLHLSSSDIDASILLLEDFGPLTNILDFIKARYVRKDPNLAEIAIKLGETIGTAMATVHSEEVAKRLQTDDAVVETLSQELAGDVLRRAVIEPLRERLEGQPDAEVLYKRIAAAHGRKLDAPPCLNNGDFMPGAILLPKELAEREIVAPNDIVPAIVDWEFASLRAAGINGDMPQFLATMACELHNANSSKDLYLALLGLMKSLAGTYQANSPARTGSDTDRLLLQSACLLTGREMVNQSCDVYREIDEKTAAEMLETGAKLLRSAGNPVEGPWIIHPGQDDFGGGVTQYVLPRLFGRVD